MQGERSLRVAEEIQRVIGELFATEIRLAELGLVTVSKAHCTKDLKIADVYFSLFRCNLDKKQALQLLNKHKKYIRHVVAGKIQLKYVPELRFFIDDTLEYVDRIDELIQRIHRE